MKGVRIYIRKTLETGAELNAHQLADACGCDLRSISNNVGKMLDISVRKVDGVCLYKLSTPETAAEKYNKRREECQRSGRIPEPRSYEWKTYTPKPLPLGRQEQIDAYRRHLSWGQKHGEWSAV